MRRLAFIVGLLASPMLAQTLVIHPSVSSVAAGQSFTVNVVASGVQDLFAYQFTLTFPAGSATLNSIAQGPFLATGGTTYFISGGAQPWSEETLIGRISGVDGTGTLATFALTAAEPGPLQLSLTAVSLLDSNVASIPAVATPATVKVTIASSQPDIIITNTLSREPGTNNVLVSLTLSNLGGTAAQNVQLTIGEIDATAGATVPQSLGIIASTGRTTATLTFPASVGASGAAAALIVGGAYTGGSFQSASRITLP